MNTGKKIRNIRILKGLSQENMAEMLGISRVSYGKIERGKEPDETRLEQIAEKLGVTTDYIKQLEDKIANFFDQCTQPNVVTGSNNTQNNNFDQREIQHKLEKMALENKLLEAEKERYKIETEYWREKYGNSQKTQQLA